MILAFADVLRTLGPGCAALALVLVVVKVEAAIASRRKYHCTEGCGFATDVQDELENHMAVGCWEPPDRIPGDW